MKKLIIIRHGDYSGNNLTSNGQRQIENLATKLKKFINNDSVTIITSPVRRAYESAEILSSFFKTEPEPNHILWPSFGCLKDCEKALSLIRSNKEKRDVLIVVTHYEYMKSLPVYFAEKELDVDLKPVVFNYEILDTGEGWVIDCQQKIITHVY